jgi:hypothetical protein
VTETIELDKALPVEQGATSLVLELRNEEGSPLGEAASLSVAPTIAKADTKPAADTEPTADAQPPKPPAKPSE